MKKFKCHKIVEAALILSAIAVPKEEDEREVDHIDLILEGIKDPFAVSVDWAAKRSPQGEIGNLVGGMLVRYEDGYQSWSPANVFAAGYESLEDAEKREKKSGAIRGKISTALDKCLRKAQSNSLKLALRSAHREAKRAGE